MVPLQSGELGGHLEEEIEGEEEEDEVGRPGGEERGKLADAAHSFGESGDGPVGDANADTESNATDGAATADEESEGNGEHHADGSDEGIGNFLVPLNGEGRDIEAGAVEAVDVAAEIAPVHLKGLDDFAIEVRRRFDEFGESGDLEGRIADDGVAGEIADPTGFEEPGVLVVEPASAGGENAAADLEGGGIQFEDGKAAEEFFFGVEEIVVVDLVILAKNPALRAGVGLGRATLDDGAVGVLTLVGVGKIGVVEDEKSGGNGDTGEENRNGEAVEGDAAGFEGDDFVVLAEDAEGDEDGDEGAERSELVNGIGDEIAEVVDDDHERDVVAADVFGQFEEGEDFEEEEEGHHDDEEVVEEAAEEIEIDDGRETGVRGKRRGAVFSAGVGNTGADESLAAAEETAKSAEAGEEAGERSFATVAFHAREESEGDEGENNVGSPHADGGRDDPLTGKARAGDEEQIIGGDDDDGEESAGGPATATRLSAERNSDEGKDEAGGGKGEALLEFDAGFAPVGAVVGEELRGGTFGIAESALFGGGRGSDFDGPVTAAESGDGVVIGDGAVKFVSGAVIEVKLELAEGGFGHDNGAVRDRDLGTAFAADIGEEDAVPVSAAGGNVVDVENHVRKAFLEDAGLNGKGDLRSDESGLNGTAGAEREGSEPESDEKGERRAYQGENADGKENALATDANGSESDDLAVHGHAAETEKNADEDGHGNGEDENAGDDGEEEGDDLGEGAGVTDEDLHEFDELGNEEDESEDEKAEEGVASNFTGDVTIEDAHEEKGQCNMWG